MDFLTNFTRSITNLFENEASKEFVHARNSLYAYELSDYRSKSDSCCQLLPIATTVQLQPLLSVWFERGTLRSYAKWLNHICHRTSIENRFTHALWVYIKKMHVHSSDVNEGRQLANREIIRPLKHKESERFRQVQFVLHSCPRRRFCNYYRSYCNLDIVLIRTSKD